jgi:hypothetical protein
MNETTENFWQVWNSLPLWSPPVVFWRLHYDDQGFPLFYTQEHKPGNYIDVTPEQYQRASMRVRVRNGQLVELDTTLVKKLVPSAIGTPCHPRDVAVVAGIDCEHQCWRLKTHESN